MAAEPPGAPPPGAAATSCALPPEGNTVAVAGARGADAGVNPLNNMPDTRNTPQGDEAVRLSTEREVRSRGPGRSRRVALPPGRAPVPPSSPRRGSGPPPALRASHPAPRAPPRAPAPARAPQVSTIPSSSAQAPAHQPGPAGGAAERRWVYPSEQMFYNAMKRKGWDPDAKDMETVVKIHNAVNERAWSEIVQWERANHPGCGAGPRLVRFLGKPNDYSPKARWLNLLGYRLPFDRHDWVVDRCGEEVRYVIDFYAGAAAPGAPAAMHLDVRPALDSPSALWDRVRMQCRWIASGRWMD